MHIGVIADIHGNIDALESVLAALERAGVDEIVNLGDSFSGPLDAAAVAERLLPLNLPSVRGNHDRALVATPPEKMAAWERWIYGDLTPRHLDWLRALPKTLTRGDLFLCHGTPQSDAENWLDERGPDHRMHMAKAPDIAARCYGERAPVILCAHTHVPRIVRMPEGQLIVNPGSVGVPAYLDIRYDPPFEMETGAPDARFAIVERAGGGWQAALHTVAYDPRRMIALAKTRGTGIWTAPLATGFARGFPDRS